MLFRKIRDVGHRWGGEVLVTLAVAFVLAFAWMPAAGVSLPNERTRIYLAVAMVDHQTLSIDEPVRRWGRPYDIARFEGRYYTDKAPGTSFLAAAVYGAARLFAPSDAFTIESLIVLMRRAISLPLGVLGFCFFRSLGRRLSMPAWAVDWSSVAWILGSAAAHASGAFFGHQMVSTALVASLWLYGNVEDRVLAERPRSWHYALGLGLTAGFALLTEYQSAIPFALLALYILSGPLIRHPRTVAWMVLGAVPGVAGLLIYNRLAFGGYFELSYHHLLAPSLQALHGTGIGGVHMPKTAYAEGALLSWHRGLLKTSPYFVLLIPGVVVLWKRGKVRLGVLLALVFSYYVLFVCSTQIWFAGWGFGPRLMVPMMGLSCLAVTAGLATLSSPLLRGLGIGLCLWAIVYTQLVNVVFAELPERFENPLYDVVVPAFRQAVFAPNLAMELAGTSGYRSLVPWAVVLGGLGVWLLVRRSAAGWKRQCVQGVLALAVVAGMAAYAKHAPTVAETETEAFLHWVKKLQQQQRELWDRAR